MKRTIPVLFLGVLLALPVHGMEERIAFTADGDLAQAGREPGADPGWAERGAFHRRTLTGDHVSRPLDRAGVSSQP